jgi:DNA-binding response OmpR family regulator
VKNVLILTPRWEDGIALRDLLTDAGHRVTTARDSRSLAEEPCQPDVIVADVDPWTQEGREVIEATRPSRGTPRLIMLCTRPLGERPHPRMVFLEKPIALAELERAIIGDEEIMSV